MRVLLVDRCKHLFRDRWVVFVCSMWVQSCAGVGYLFGTISPVIKYTMGYNQRQVALLGVAKDLGDSVGFLAGILCDLLPVWGLLLIGATQSFIGYGLIWLIITHHLPTQRFWVLCLLMFIGTNGETYYNTGALVSCVRNFPKHRGPVVGILKGFAGLSGAILVQIYTLLHAPDAASILFMIAVGPSMVVIALMFIVRPVKGHEQVRPSDDCGFFSVYSVCLILAAYLLGILMLEDLLTLQHYVEDILIVILLAVILLPIVYPVVLFLNDAKLREEERLIPRPDQVLQRGDSEIILSEIESEVEDGKNDELEALSSSERRRRISQLQSKRLQAAAEGAVRLTKRNRPRRGDDFTLMEALRKADFWLLFASLALGSGSGVTVIDNMGQISQSLGYDDITVFVSMISIWNFLGRVGGGYFSELVIRKFSYPRPIAMAAVQVIMAIGFAYYSMDFPGGIYVLSILTGLGYGAHWAIVPAAVSELFGLKSFGALYNFLTLAMPIGSLLFSGVIAGGFYDYYAKKQSGALLDKYLKGESSYTCSGNICYSMTFWILSGFCFLGMILSMIVVNRTRVVYTKLYGRIGG